MLSKNVIVLLFVLIFTACKSEKGVSKFDYTKDFEIKSIVKTVDHSSSLQDSSICRSWMLNASEIRKLVKSSTPISRPEQHYYYDHLPCQLSGRIVQHSNEFTIAINSGAWWTLSSSDSTLIFGVVDASHFKYFLSEPLRDEDRN